MKRIIILCLLCSTLLCGCGDNKNVEDKDDFNATEWLANPANPASPIHQMLFHP